MSRWTDEQKTAIEAEGCSVIVSAAAGSGKTSVLVERLLRIISDSEKQIPVERMIIATFTRDAAAEMKQRLSVSLSGLIEKDPGNAWAARQNAMLGCASISTISSFCLELLRRNISQLDFTSGFRVADETEEAVFRTQAYKSVSEYFYSEHFEDMLTLRSCFCGTDDDMLEAMIYDLYDCVSSVPFFDRWLDSAYEKYGSDFYRKIYSGYINADIKECSAALESAYSAAQKLDNDKVSGMVSGERASFMNALESFDDGDYMNFSSILSGISFVKFPNPRKTDDPELRNIIINCRNRYKELIGILANRASVYAHAEEDMEKSREVLRIISDFLRIFSEELIKQKQSRNAIGFDDAERLVLDLLADVNEDGSIEKTELARELSDYYEVIMIDEYQDSNNREDMIFRLLSKGGTAEKYGSNLFFVGDVKQSIYRFRLANPDNFINVLDISEPYRKGNTGNSCIRLNKNFRSSGAVIDLSNYIFRCIMSRSCGDIDYNDDECLYQGAEFCDAQRAPVIMLFDKSEENAEPKYIAQKIAQMLRDKVPVSTDGGKSSRPCEMRDFCILMRGNKNIPLYAHELEKLGIGTESNVESGYLKARETSVLINLLRTADNPLLDAPIMSVMLSPMFMFTADEAAMVRLVDKKASIYMNICKGIGAGGDAPLFEGELLLKSRFLHSVITELRLYAGACTLQELVRKIYDSTDFMSVMQLYGDAEKKKANLRMMLEYVGNYEKNFDGGLTGFVRYIDSITESGGDFDMASAGHGSQNAVSIKSMHKSKGLEFPFVFIAGTGTKFNKMDNTKPFRFSYDLGLGFRLQNPELHERYAALPYEVIAARAKLESISEEMRLLYVAMTRAKERLFITLNCNSSAVKKAQSLAGIIYEQGGITPKIAASADSMADWLYMCLISHSKSAKLRELFEIYESFRYDFDFEIEYEICTEHDSHEQIAAMPDRRSSSDSEIKRKLREMISFKYDLSLSALTAKLSVSDISKNENDFDAPLKRPAFAIESGGLTPAEKGTALHKFLQFADFAALEKDIGSELERLYESGYLSKKQMESVKKSDVEAFLKSGLYDRIRKCIRVHRERKFLVSIDELNAGGEIGRSYKETSGMLNGIIDMILEFDDGLVLVDYKTDRISDLNELAVRYSGQLELYRKALQMTETKPVKETLIYSFYKKCEIKV